MVSQAGAQVLLAATTIPANSSRKNTSAIILPKNLFIAFLLFYLFYLVT
jgi:hypothetical protein